MSSKSRLSPPLLPDNEKFDGTNYIEWSESILMACQLRGVRGYLDGTIHIPTTYSANYHLLSQAPSKLPNPPLLLPPRHPGLLPTPSWEEWDARDAWCLIAIKTECQERCGVGYQNGWHGSGRMEVFSRAIPEIPLTSPECTAQRELRSVRLGEGGRLYCSHVRPTHKT